MTRVFDCNQRDWMGQTALPPSHQVAEQGFPAPLFAVLISAGADVNAKDNEGHKPLLIASQRVLCCCQTPAEGVEEDVEEDMFGIAGTPGDRALRVYAELTSALLKATSKLSQLASALQKATSPFGQLKSQLSPRDRHLFPVEEVVELLLAAGADVAEKNKAGYTSVWLAMDIDALRTKGSIRGTISKARRCPCARLHSD